MAEEYVVYVSAPAEAPSAESRRRLAELLRLDPPKLDSLLRRLPAEITKPIPESTALTVARRFRQAGLAASIRRPGASPSGAAQLSSAGGQGSRSDAPWRAPADPSRADDAGTARDRDETATASRAEAPSESRVTPRAATGEDGSSAARTIPGRPGAATSGGASSGPGANADAGSGKTRGGARPRTDTYLRRSDREAQEESEALWRTGVGAKQIMVDAPDEDDDDELFPPSSFTSGKGPKAPSRPLVIALVAVVLLLAALWVLL